MVEVSACLWVVYKLGWCYILQDNGDHLIAIQTVLQHLTGFVPDKEHIPIFLEFFLETTGRFSLQKSYDNLFL